MIAIGHHVAVAPRARRLARAGFVLGLELTAAALLVVAIRSPSTTAQAPVDPVFGADAVAARPGHFRSIEVRVRGRILTRPAHPPGRDRDAFVLGGSGGGRLLVVPADDARPRAFRAGTDVVVRGTVVIPPASKRLERHPTSRTAVAKEARASAILEAIAVRYSP
jgi:hypothetical protein